VCCTAACCLLLSPADFSAVRRCCCSTTAGRHSRNKHTRQHAPNLHEAALLDTTQPGCIHSTSSQPPGNFNLTNAEQHNTINALHPAAPSSICCHTALYIRVTGCSYCGVECRLLLVLFLVSLPLQKQRLLCMPAARAAGGGHCFTGLVPMLNSHSPVAFGLEAPVQHLLHLPTQPLHSTPLHRSSMLYTLSPHSPVALGLEASLQHLLHLPALSFAQHVDLGCSLASQAALAR
jgi:hypothetical protein